VWTAKSVQPGEFAVKVQFVTTGQLVNLIGGDGHDLRANA
jgi:hypothetical protein